MSPFERYDLMYGSPADEAPEYEHTQADYILAFHMADACSLESAMYDHLERMHPGAHMPDDDLTILPNWLDAMGQLSHADLDACLDVMAKIESVWSPIKSQLAAIERAAYLHRRAA